MKPLAPNTLIQNRYLIVQLIGKGGMGEVYLAVDQRLGSAVALKRTYFAADEMLGNAFEREARILARLRHPVLPKVSDHFSENGEQYLVMEHISGDDLSKRLEAAQNAFPSSWVLFWADQLLDALSYLHSHEPPIIHRDIKPQNLKLTDENHIVLLDFGLSKNSTGQTNVPSSKSSGSVVGYTPHYAPMEQIRGTGTGPRSDLYSLSATLFQLMTNSVPPDALTRADAMLNAMADPISKISDLNLEISPAVSEVILHGMEVSQEKRFGSAREMQKALRKAYSAMHEAMSAQTMIYGGPEAYKDGITGTNKPLGSPADQYIPASEAMTQTPGTDSSGFPSGGSFQNVPAADADSGPSFDATVKYDGVIDSQVRQADVKTEVYSADDSELISSGFENPTPYNSNPVPPVEDFRATENISAGQGFSPDATVPIISLEDTGAVPSPAGESSASDFFTTPNVPSELNSYATVTSPKSSHQISGAATAYVPAEQPLPVKTPAVKKKSSSRLIIALVALAVLFVLAIAGAGGGWYVYSNYYAVTPTPTPQPSLEITPTPEPTLENIDNSNSEVLTVSPTPVPTATATPEISETPVQTRPTPQVQVKETPTRPARTPVPKQSATPRPKPSILP